MILDQSPFPVQNVVEKLLEVLMLELTQSNTLALADLLDLINKK
jgi:hypothetical protein